MRVLITALVALSCSLGAQAQSPAARIPVEHFSTLNGFTLPEISPDGKHLAFLYPLDERQHLVVQDLESGENLTIPPKDGADFRWLRWANNDTLVFSVALSAVRIGGARTETIETRLSALNINYKELVALIPPAEQTGTTGSRTARSYYPEIQVQDNVIDWIPDDPDHILVAVDEDFDNRHEVRKVNVNSGDYRLFRRSIEGIQDWVVDRDGEVRLGTGVRLGEQRVVFQDADGEWLALDKIDWYRDGWRPHGFTEDPEVIYVLGYGDHGTRELRTLNTRTGEFVDTIFSHDTYDLASVLYHPVENYPIGIGYTAHRRHYEYFDEEFDVLQRSIDRVLPDSRNYIHSASADLSKIVIVSSNSFEPGMVVVWDRNAKSFEPFGWYNEHLDPELMAEVRPVSYEADDGVTIPAYLTLPKGSHDGPLPAIVLPHGGPASRDDTEFWFLSQFLVSRGYAVLQPNFRGSSGYGYQFREAGRSQWGGLMQRDVDAGARWLVEQGIADPDRICIVGWSYGGYSAAIGLAQSPDLYRCGVGINGVYDLPQMIADDREYVGGTIWTRHVGLDGESAKSVSPVHQAEKIESPMLIIHADDDHRVRVKQAEGFHRELQKLGKESSLVIVDHGGHSMVNADSRKKILAETEAFLAKHIGSSN